MNFQQSRTKTLNQILKAPSFDVIIIGGGIHGVIFARYASQYGIKTLLLEKSDYASGTSSKSSKMAHGGLRYLELFDFEQVFEGIKAREQLFANFPHLAYPYRFLIPVTDTLNRLKMKTGLSLYDLFVKNPERKHYWQNPEDLQFPFFNKEQIIGSYAYTDGIMNDYRLVIENLDLAQKTGALCLNYCKVEEVRKNKNYQVTFSDQKNEQDYSIQAKYIINCAGAFANQFAIKKHPLKFSRGSHLIFKTPWEHPALFLPMEGKARYYFVWPHFAGTMVGTTEREVLEPDSIVEPAQDEIAEILARLKKDLPHANLNRSTLTSSFAGLRFLPLRKNSQDTSKISRKHIWSLEDNVLSLFGGKFTTAEWTVREGFKKLLQESDNFNQEKFNKALINTSAGQRATELKAFYSHLSELNLDPTLLKRIKFNPPTNLNSFQQNPDYFEVIDDSYLKGEHEIAFSHEQAMTENDFTFRRSGTAYQTKQIDL